MPARLRVELCREPIQVDTVLAELDDPGSGAVILFLGRVRDHHQGRSVRSIDYQAYEEMALPILKGIAEEVAATFPVEAVTLVHRIGHLQVGEASVLVAVAAGHRDEAFQACRHGIERLKQDVPIWKKELLADGSAEWVDVRTGK
jgi:molybdopterin synthase catalytic subunit